MEVRRNKGLAIHIGREPCIVVREGGCEAPAKERLVKIHIPGTDAIAKVEGNTDGRISASARMARRGRRTWHMWKLVVREPGDPTSDQSRLSDMVCIGKARSHSR